MTDTTLSGPPAMAAAAAPSLNRDADAAVPLWAWAAWVVTAMAVAAIVPFDASYDVAHYHIHNGWAAWNDRIDRDFAPADMHSFLNPAYNVFAWWLIERLPGPLVNSVLVIPAALTVPALFYLARTVSTIMVGQASRATCLAVAFVGFMAEGQVGVFASIRNDAWGAAAFLGALALTLSADGRLANWRRLVAASLLLGGVLGMKLTNLPYVIGYGVLVMLLARSWTERLRVGAICGAAGLFSVACLFGPHAWVLWERFANPVFPVANDIFQSPVGPTEFDTYERRRPGLLYMLVYPFAFTWDGSLIGSEHSKDLRFLLAYISAPVLLARVWLGHRKGETPDGSRPVIALSAAILVAMVLWMQGFSVLRYLLAAWMIGPLMLMAVYWAVAGKPAPDGRSLRILGAGAIALLLLTNFNALRRASWDNFNAPYISAEIANPERFNNAFILFTGDYPSAFLAPLFPETATFAAAVPQDYFRPALENYRPRLRAALAAQPDLPIYAVMFVDDTAPPLDRTSVLAKLNAQEHLVGDPAACEDLPNNFDLSVGDWILCPVHRQSGLALRPTLSPLWTAPPDLG